MPLFVCRVVKHLNVIEHVLPCSIACDICLPPDAFPFQKLEEAFGDCVVVAIPAPAHACKKIVFSKKRQVLFAGELRTLIGMDHHLVLWFAPPDRCKQSLKSEICRHALLHGPTDDTS
jgi:hypothetical protein